MNTQFYKEMLDSLTEGIYFVNRERQVTYWNKAAERLSGYTAKEIIGKGCADNFLRHVNELGTELCIEGCPLAATMEDGKPREANVFMHHKFGHRVPVFVRSFPMRDESGAIIGAVEIFSDNGKQIDIVHEIEKLQKEVLKDPLTGIGNRRFAEVTMDRIDQSMTEYNISFGILVVDIDHFEDITKSMGNQMGERIISMVGQTLKAMLRTLDVACRWDHKTFAIFIPNTTVDGLCAMSERLKMLVQSAWLDHEGERVRITASFGGTSSEKNQRASFVLDQAEKQVALSRQGGGDCIHINGVRITD